MSIEEQDTQVSRFPGHEFVQARERKHISIDQVSTELHLPIKVIHAIESGNPQSIHNPVFVRGYIRTYAKHLGMDPAHYANLYANLPGVDLKPASIRSTTSVQERDPSRSPWIKLFSWLFVLAIIAIVIWWSREQSGRAPVITDIEQSTSVESDGSMLDNEVIDPRDATGSVDSDTLNTSESSSAELPSEATSVSEVDVYEQAGMTVETPDPVISPSLDDQVQPEVDTGAGLVMRFSGDCWVQVRDASDALIYSGVAQGGSELQLEGDVPLSLVIGRRDAVEELRFNGEVIDLASFTSGNVARFSLPLSQ